jgi:hypothetical protein
MALGYWDFRGGTPVQAGAVTIPTAPCDAFFVTLNKTEKDYSPTTMFEDYAIDESQFHWQSQNSTTESTDVGKRYLTSNTNGHLLLLFARVDKDGPVGSNPYYFLGPVQYLSHTGSKPMSILWRLSIPMPASILQQLRRLIT